MKRNVKKRCIPVAAMRQILSENSEASSSAEMEPSTASTQRGNTMAEYSKYSHPRAHLKFEDREVAFGAFERSRVHAVGAKAAMWENVTGCFFASGPCEKNDVSPSDKVKTPRNKQGTAAS